MKKTTGKRSDRLVIPLKDDERSTIDLAAELSGLAPTTFARRVLLRQSQARIERLKPAARSLNEAAWRAFVAATENPARPNDALQRAAQRSGLPQAPAPEAPARK
jgi:uncharacterized protein (DUF1778 family)